MSTLSKFLLDLELNLEENDTAQPAWAIIESYLAIFNAPVAGQHLWQMVIGNLTNEKLFHLQSAENRYQLLFFYEYTVLFVKAVQVALVRRAGVKEAIEDFDKKIGRRIKRNQEEIAHLVKQKALFQKPRTAARTCSKKLSQSYPAKNAKYFVTAAVVFSRIIYPVSSREIPLQAVNVGSHHCFGVSRLYENTV